MRINLTITKEESKILRQAETILRRFVDTLDIEERNIKKPLIRENLDREIRDLDIGASICWGYHFGGSLYLDGDFNNEIHIDVEG